MLNKTFIRRYRFDINTVDKLLQLKKYRIKESDFIRQAISEKLSRDLPAIKEKHERIKYPF